MADNVTGLPRLGATYFTGPNRTAPTSPTTSIGLEGITKTFADVTPGQGAGVDKQRSGHEKVCRLVRNVSGIALLPGRVVVYKSGFYGKRVDGYVTTDYALAAGVVDEHLPAAGCPNNDMCWITVHGPTVVKSDIAAAATNVISQGDPLVALTAATSQATTAGRIQPYVATSNATQAASQAMNRIGRAMSASTTNNTNNSLLTYVDLLK